MNFFFPEASWGFPLRLNHRRIHIEHSGASGPGDPARPKKRLDAAQKARYDQDVSITSGFQTVRQGQKAKRLASIILMLRTSRSQTAVELAATLGVTVRTVYRDLDDLVASGIPIRGTPGPAGGYELAEHYPIDPFVYVQTDPLPILGGPPESLTTGNALATAVSLLADSLPDDARAVVHRARERFFFDTSAWLWKDSNLSHFPDLKHAVLNDQRAEIVFTPRGSPDIQSDFVDPYGLVWRQGNWYLVVFSESRRRFERHRIQRILGVKLTGQVFERKAGFELAATWAQLLDDFGKGKELVRLRIDFPATKDFEAFGWKPDQVIQKFDDHWIVEMRVDNDEWLIPLALSYGDKFQILEPLSLRNRVASALESALRVYRSVKVPGDRSEDFHRKPS